MQYVGSPQTSFRFGSSVTRSVSVSSLVSIGEGTSEGGAPGSSVGGDAAGSLLSGGVPGGPGGVPGVPSGPASASSSQNRVLTADAAAAAASGPPRAGASGAASPDDHHDGFDIPGGDAARRAHRRGGSSLSVGSLGSQGSAGNSQTNSAGNSTHGGGTGGVGGGDGSYHQHRGGGSQQGSYRNRLGASPTSWGSIDEAATRTNAGADEGGSFRRGSRVRGPGSFGNRSGANLAAAAAGDDLEAGGGGRGVGGSLGAGSPSLSASPPGGGLGSSVTSRENLLEQPLLDLSSSVPPRAAALGGGGSYARRVSRSASQRRLVESRRERREGRAARGEGPGAGGFDVVVGFGVEQAKGDAEGGRIFKDAAEGRVEGPPRRSFAAVAAISGDHPERGFAERGTAGEGAGLSGPGLAERGGFASGGGGLGASSSGARSSEQPSTDVVFARGDDRRGGASGRGFGFGFGARETGPDGVASRGTHAASAHHHHQPAGLLAPSSPRAGYVLLRDHPRDRPYAFDEGEGVAVPGARGGRGGDPRGPIGDAAYDARYRSGASEYYYYSPRLERFYARREHHLVCLLLGVSFCSAALIAAPVPTLPGVLMAYGYDATYAGVAFGSFALAAVFASHAFNAVGAAEVENGRVALMVVGLFLQGAGGLSFGVVPQFGFRASTVFALFVACRALTGVGVATTHLAVFAAINETLREKTLIVALRRAEMAVAAGFAFAMPAVAYMTHLGGFRLPFQALGLLVLLNMVWIAVDPGVLSPPERWMEDPSDISDESDDEEVGGGVGGGVRPREADGRLGENPRSAASRDAAVGFSPSPAWGTVPPPPGPFVASAAAGGEARPPVLFAPGGDAEAGRGGPAAANRGPAAPPGDGAGALAAGGGGRPHRPPRRKSMLSRSFSSADLKPDGKGGPGPGGGGEEKEKEARDGTSSAEGSGRGGDGGDPSELDDPPAPPPPASPPPHASPPPPPPRHHHRKSPFKSPPPREFRVSDSHAFDPWATRDHPAADFGFSGRRRDEYHHHHHLPGERPPGGDPFGDDLDLDDSDFDSDFDDHSHLTFAAVLKLVTPRLFLAGFCNVAGCLAFGLAQPMLSLRLSQPPLSWSVRDVGWGQFMVTAGYALGMWPAHLAVARGVARAESVCVAGTLVAGATLFCVGMVERKVAVLASLFAFGTSQAFALVPTLEAMKLAAPAVSARGAARPLAAEGATRLFNVFQDVGQVFGPVLAGWATTSLGFEGAARAVGTGSCAFAVVAAAYFGAVKPIPRWASAAHFTFTER